MFPCYVLLLALLASAQGRAVNISNTWVLPEEGFPVFYRYFRDRISWYEADAVCQFHHANLVTVDTTAQYDAVRAYLKELDISSAVWVGLIRSNPDGEFTWTDYRGLSGDGYWSSAPDARAAPLCAAADPAADYRWEARTCGGPTVASFICELPVPQWATGNQGCMVRSLPALTVLYLPESAAVQLTADCGLAGTRRVQCTGNVSHEDLLKNLSCADEDPSSTPTFISTSEADISYTDIDTGELVTYIHTSSEGQDITTATSSPDLPSLHKKQQILTIEPAINRLKSQYFAKDNLDLIHYNNLQSNDIPKLPQNDIYLTAEQNEKLEDEKLLHHKMIHEELARNGNLDTIFTDPMDHFIPPLVMAKAKINDDMAEMSLAEKHAQQLAEQRFAKYHLKNELVNHANNDQSGNIPKGIIERPSVMQFNDEHHLMVKPLEKKKENEKKDKIKQGGTPKKYKEKYESPKGKNAKIIIDNKIFKIDKMETKINKQMQEINKDPPTTTTHLLLNDSPKAVDDKSINLTVMLKELGMGDSRASLYTNTSGVTHLAENNNDKNKSDNRKLTKNQNVSNSSKTQINTTIFPMNHEVIKITIFNDENSTNTAPTVFEITTRMPDQEKTTQGTTKSTNTETSSDTVTIDNNNSKNNTTTLTYNNQAETNSTVLEIKFKLDLNTTEAKISEGNITAITWEEILTDKNVNINVTDSDYLQATTQDKYITISSTTPFTTTTTEEFSANVTETINENNNLVNITEPLSKENEVKDLSTVQDVVTQIYNVEVNNHTDTPDEKYTKNETEVLEAIDDTNSPLLSGASEPLHRPNRSRRPQPPNRLAKFSPFRILG